MAIPLSQLESQTLLEYGDTIVTKEEVERLAENEGISNNIYVLCSPSFLSSHPNNNRNIHKVHPKSGELVIVD